MATSNIIGGERVQRRPAGHNTGALGPSDTSDSGSDVQGARGFDALDVGDMGGDLPDLDSDTDASGTGERGAAVHDATIVEGADIAPDRIDVLDASAEEEASDDDALDLDDLAVETDTDDDAEIDAAADDVAAPRRHR